MSHTFDLRRRAAVPFLLLALSLIPVLTAEEDKEEKAPYDPKNGKDAGVGMPTPDDKFIALDQVLTKTKVNWEQTFRKVAVDIDPDSFTDKDVAIPMVLGIRIAD